MICSLASCDKQVKNRGWCSAHYSKWLRYGDPLGGYNLCRLPIKDRLEILRSHYPEDACWEWMWALGPFGYGILGKRTRAHRASWEEEFGPIPDGLCVLHKCDNPPCVNPSHLFLGTRADNNRDMCAKGRAWHSKEKGTSSLQESWL